MKTLYRFIFGGYLIGCAAGMSGCSADAKRSNYGTEERGRENGLAASRRAGTDPSLQPPVTSSTGQIGSTGAQAVGGGTPLPAGGSGGVGSSGSSGPRGNVKNE